MPHPILAIVGRPNVGKSRLFNRLTGRYQALVDDTSGVTRDRHYGYADWRGQTFVVVDTGGLISGSEDPLNQKVWGQAFLAIQEASAIVCLFDGQTGLTPVDEALVSEMRRVGKPVFYCVNKIDAASHEKFVSDFAKLGVEPLIAVSAEHGRGISDLLEAMIPHFPPSPPREERAGEGLRLAIIGRPNVGKSTLLNQLARQERVVVHEEAGTTRDAIDVLIKKDGKEFVFVDTAGIKRKKMTKTRLDKFSVMASLKAIDQSRVVLFLLDPEEGGTHQERHLIHHIWNNGKALLLLVNKWDLVKLEKQKYISALQSQLGELQNIPVLCISAKTGEGCSLIWNKITKMEAQLQRRIETHPMNEWLESVVDKNPPPACRGRDVRIYYATQVAIQPPHIVLFANEPKGVTVSYLRYLKRQFFEAFGLEGVPVRFSVRRRQ